MTSIFFPSNGNHRMHCNKNQFKMVDKVLVSEIISLFFNAELKILQAN